MKRKISNQQEWRQHRDELSRLIINEGYYQGFRKTFEQFDMPLEYRKKLEAMLFRHILKKIEEGRREIQKLQATFNRLHAVCNRGTNWKHNIRGTAPTIDIWGELGTSMQAMDGWAISLLETSISLLMIIQNPETGANRVKGLQESFSSLWTERAKKLSPIDNHPELFDLTYY
jgi:hypothetical protein